MLQRKTREGEEGFAREHGANASSYMAINIYNIYIHISGHRPKRGGDNNSYSYCKCMLAENLER